MSKNNLRYDTKSKSVICMKCRWSYEDIGNITLQQIKCPHGLSESIFHNLQTLRTYDTQGCDMTVLQLAQNCIVCIDDSQKLLCTRCKWSTDDIHCITLSNIKCPHRNRNCLHKPEILSSTNPVNGNDIEIVDEQTLHIVKTLSLSPDIVDRAVDYRRRSTGIPFTGPVELMKASLRPEYEHKPPTIQNTPNRRRTTFREYAKNKRAFVKSQKRAPSTESFALLQTALATMEEEQKCIICQEYDQVIVFLPCGHFCCCSVCSPALKHCCMCRTLIAKTVKVTRFP